MTKRKQTERAAQQSKQDTKQRKTNRPKDPVKSKAGKASAAARKVKRENGDPVTRPCSARRTNGEPCKNSAIRGGTVCARHGGSAPQVRAKANQRLIEMVLPAMRELNRILNSPHTNDADKLKAIQLVLNRTGYSERHVVDIGLREPSKWDLLTGDDSRAFVIDRSALAGSDEPAALGGGGEWDDDTLEAALARRDRDREQEATTRLDNSGHDVVPGEYQREAADPFDTAERERRDYDRNRTEMDGGRLAEEPAYEDRLRERVEESARRTGRRR